MIPERGDLITDSKDIPLPQHRSHPREWRQNVYVYPVISRRSGGLSIGVNLNPDAACNLDCVYCQVDRSRVRSRRDIDLHRFQKELEWMIADAKSGALFADANFANVPHTLREIKDIAFSGDGEPTACRHFRECVELVAALWRKSDLPGCKIVLITNACYLTRPEVVAGLEIMDRSNGEIWAKLDAGSEAYYRRVNRPSHPLQHVIDNVIAAAGVRPVVIQSLFMRLDDHPPDKPELQAYADRLNEIVQGGGHIKYVQVYTVARPPAEGFVTPLTKDELENIAALVRRRTGLLVMTFGVGG